MAPETKKASSANPTVLAMDHPITLLMLVVTLISLGGLALGKMRVDIFPSLNTPKIYVFFDFIGMSPDQVEGFIVNELELDFQYVRRHPGHQVAEHPAGRPGRALVLPRHPDG